MATHAHTTPTAAHGNLPTRRLILTAFTGAAFAGTAVVIAAPSVAAAAVNPDAELIAACHRFAFLEQENCRLCVLVDWPLGHELTPAEQALQDEADAVMDEQLEIGTWLTDQRPRTDAGRQAKAQAVIAYGGLCMHDMITRLTLSLVQDVAAERAL